MKTMQRKYLGGGTTTKLFFRMHWHSAPRFSRASASSAPWGEDSERIRGYSAFDNPIDLAEYFGQRNRVDSDAAQLVVFEGASVGTGPDGEDLVIPLRANEGFRAFIAPESLPALVQIWDETDDREMAEDAIAAAVTRRT